MLSKIRHVLILLIIPLLFFLIWECLRYVLVDEGNSYTRVTMHEYYDQDKIDVAFIGASHCYRGLKPQVIDEYTDMNTYNLGSSAQPIEVSFLLLKDVVKRYRPEHIYVDLSYNMTSKDFSLETSYLVTDYMKPSLEKEWFLLSNSDDDTYVNSFFPARRYSDKIFDKEYLFDVAVKKDNLSYSEYGYVDNNYEWYSGKGYVASNVEMDDGSFFDRGVKDGINLEDITDSWKSTIEKMLLFCKENDVNVTFISIPVSSYRLVAYEDYDLYIEYISNIVNTYGYEYVDFNLLNEKIWKDTAQYYMDNDHLNELGAEKFSEVFSMFMQGELENSRDFYGSIKEKYASIDAQFYGVIGLKEYSNKNTYKLVTNDEGSFSYRISIIKDDSKCIINDWSNKLEFDLPKDYYGECYIDVSNSQNGETTLYSININ